MEEIIIILGGGNIYTKIKHEITKRTLQNMCL